MGWSEKDQAAWEARNPQVGEEGGLDWITAGALGALIGVGDEALLTFLGSFVAYVVAQTDTDVDPEKVLEFSQGFLADYRRYLKEQGVANA